MASAIVDSTVTINHLQLLVEQEKAGLARHIHDDLGSLLIATAMDLAHLKRLLSDADNRILERFERATASLNAAVDMMRRVTEELHPTLLDNVGLIAALQWQIKQVCQRSQVLCREVFPSSELRLRPATSITLFRVCQEALIALENQSGVTVIDFSLAVEGSSLTIDIEADGSDAMPADGSAGRVALEFLRHRVDAMQGSVAMRRSRAGGLGIVIDVQLEQLSASDTQAVRALEVSAHKGR